MNYLYLVLNIATILFPLLLSFDKKVAFYKKWKSIIPAILLSGLFFISWDHFFTKWNIWQFNEKYVLGYYLLGLPLEEWLFFFTVPYAVLFIYEVIKAYSGNHIFSKAGKITAVSLAIILAVTAFIFFDKIYTSFTFLLASCLLFLHVFLLKHRFSGVFFIAYFIQLIPFLIINGILTSMPVVVYNALENTGLKIFSIPVEDCIYSLTILLINVSFYEGLELIGNFKNKESESLT
jgi:lycopene cyclase domain-containing protein